MNFFEVIVDLCLIVEISECTNYIPSYFHSPLCLSPAAGASQNIPVLSYSYIKLVYYTLHNVASSNIEVIRPYMFEYYCYFSTFGNILELSS